MSQIAKERMFTEVNTHANHAFKEAVQTAVIRYGEGQYTKDDLKKAFWEELNKEAPVHTNNLPQYSSIFIERANRCF